MPIITISRGSYSRGKAVAEKLAEKLGYECLSRDVLLEASEEFNTPEIRLVRALHDAPSVLDRFRFGKERYLSYLVSALLQHVKKDNVVYHGLAGHFLLRSIPHVFKVRIIAPMADRVQEEMRREDLPEDKARAILEKDDEERRSWSKALYGIDSWDSRLYDMVLKIGRLTAEDAVDLIAEAVQKPTFQPDAQALELVKDMALAARVKAALAVVAPRIQVGARGDTVSIGGAHLSTSFETQQQIREAAEKVEGVEEVVFSQESRPHQDYVNPFHNLS